ncbi:MAG: NADH-quinone oxidoreductase subunit J, partial [Verrucomicrobiae bacterium]|nr:NADH-quinone oxidoreductase subunit J [Verrucomicrobiae bacterium]
LLILGKTLTSGHLPPSAAEGAVGSTKALGTLLFTQGQYLLPFEVVSLLLLSAMMGVILLSKKDIK